MAATEREITQGYTKEELKDLTEEHTPYVEQFVTQFRKHEEDGEFEQGVLIRLPDIPLDTGPWTREEGPKKPIADKKKAQVVGIICKLVCEMLKKDYEVTRMKVGDWRTYRFRHELIHADAMDFGERDLMIDRISHSIDPWQIEDHPHAPNDTIFKLRRDACVTYVFAVRRDYLPPPCQDPGAARTEFLWRLNCKKNDAQEFVVGMHSPDFWEFTSAREEVARNVKGVERGECVYDHPASKTFYNREHLPCSEFMAAYKQAWKEKYDTHKDVEGKLPIHTIPDPPCWN